MINPYTVIDQYGDVVALLELDATNVAANTPNGCTTVEGHPPGMAYRWVDDGWVALPARPGKGWTWDGQTGAWVDGRSLDTAKADKAAEVLAARRAYETSDFTVAGATFLADESSRTMLASTLVLAREYEEATSQPFSTVWKLANGATTTLTRAQLRDLALALGARVQAAFEREAELRLEITAAATAEDVALVQWTDPGA